MTTSISPFSSALEVLGIFIIPFGGGIPAGVLLARTRGLEWPVMMLLYFVSDVILALLFDPTVRLFTSLAKRSPELARFLEVLRESTNKTIAKYGLHPGPLTLILISFGVDPMTGRTMSRLAGYGFLSGWSLAICGDMIFFSLIMVSTLFLGDILGDGTWASIIILVAMTVIPVLVRRFREFWRNR